MTDSGFMHTNAALVELWCVYQALKGFSHRTLGRRRWSIGKLLDFVGDAPLLALSGDQVEAWLATYPGVQTRYSLRADARQFYLWAIRKGHTATDPTLMIDPPKLPKRLPTPLAVIDVERLLAAAHGDDRALVLLASHGGLRVSETAALSSADIQNGCAHVRNGKGGRDRVVPLSTETLAALPQRDGRLFPVTPDGPSVSRRIKLLMRSLCIVGRPHDLRHSFGTQLARNGVELLVIAQLMGHENLQTTRNYILLAAPDRRLVENLYGRAA